MEPETTVSDGAPALSESIEPTVTVEAQQQLDALFRLLAERGRRVRAQGSNPARQRETVDERRNASQPEVAPE